MRVHRTSFHYVVLFFFFVFVFFFSVSLVRYWSIHKPYFISTKCSVSEFWKCIGYVFFIDNNVIFVWTVSQITSHCCFFFFFKSVKILTLPDGILVDVLWYDGVCIWKILDIWCVTSQKWYWYSTGNRTRNIFSNTITFVFVFVFVFACKLYSTMRVLIISPRNETITKKKNQPTITRPTRHTLIFIAGQMRWKCWNWLFSFTVIILGRSLLF